MSGALSRQGLIRWAGSKRQLLPQLSRFWSGGKYTRYVEPFAGSAALFFLIRPTKALLGDLNGELVNALKCVASRPKHLFNTLTLLPRHKTFYKAARATPTSELKSFERAVRFFHLNRHCFNGLYRTNVAGQFNVPFAPDGAGEYPTLARFVDCAALLRNAAVLQSDFERLIIDNVAKGDFVYLDPPFAVANRRLFRQYGSDTFGLNDLDRLKASLSLIDRRGASFVLSYADSPEARELVKGWRFKRVFVRRSVAGFGDDRRKSVELIVSNIETWPTE